MSMIGEADIVGEPIGNDLFLINGAAPPINIQNFNQSEYMLAITIGISLQDYDVSMSITFDLLSNISTIDGMTSTSFASATLFITSELMLHTHSHTCINNKIDTVKKWNHWCLITQKCCGMTNFKINFLLTIA